MKKLLAVLFALIFVLSCFSACGGNKENGDDTTAASAEVTDAADDTEASDVKDTTANNTEVSEVEDTTEEPVQEEENTVQDTAYVPFSGAASTEEFADLYFKAIYQDMDEDAILALCCEDYWNLFFTLGDWNFASFEEAMENFRSYLREGLDTMKTDFETNGIDAASLTCTVTEDEPIDEKLRAYNGSLAEAGFSCVLTDAKLYNVSIIAPDGNEYTTDLFVTAEIEGNWYLISSYAISMWL